MIHTEGEPKDVLVVDDDPGIRELVRYAIEDEFRGLRVAEARDGQAGLDQIALLRPRLVFLDLHLPRLTGLEVARLWRARDPERTTLIVGFTSKQLREDPFEGNSDGVVIKPFDLEELFEPVRRFIRPEIPVS